MNTLTVQECNILSRRYLDRLPTDSSTAARVTDKLPGNFLHLGFIQMMFPNARIVHCRRNPIDTCLSCYFQDFGGLLAYTFKLEDLGFYYREYERLMEHWRNVLDLPILEVDYEQMVGDPETS